MLTGIEKRVKGQKTKVGKKLAGRQTVIKRSKGKGCGNAALGCIDLVQRGDGSVERRRGAAAAGGGVVDGRSLPLDKRKVLLQRGKSLLGVGNCRADLHGNDAIHCQKKQRRQNTRSRRQSQTALFFSCLMKKKDKKTKREESDIILTSFYLHFHVKHRSLF